VILTSPPLLIITGIFHTTNQTTNPIQTITSNTIINHLLRSIPVSLQTLPNTKLTNIMSRVTPPVTKLTTTLSRSLSTSSNARSSNLYDQSRHVSLYLPKNINSLKNDCAKRSLPTNGTKLDVSYTLIFPCSWLLLGKVGIESNANILGGK